MPLFANVESDDKFRDLFNLVCGDLLGEGIHRKVFECRFDPTLVVKVEQGHSTFSNVREWANWYENQHYKKVSDWLAPCVDISPNGLILFQRRVIPVTKRDQLPEKLPSWITDVKPQNFGWFSDRLVIHDYPQLLTNMPKGMRKADWTW